MTSETRTLIELSDIAGIDMECPSRIVCNLLWYHSDRGGINGKAHGIGVYRRRVASTTNETGERASAR